MSLEIRLAELKKDILSPHGPEISTNRNYPFAIFQYAPQEEFEMRRRIGMLVDELRALGWQVRDIDLLKVLFEYLEAEEGGDLIVGWIEEEKLQYTAHGNNYGPPLDFLKQALDGVMKDETALPQRVRDNITALAGGGPAERTVVFLSRIGALYPVFKTSTLLRYLDKGVRVPTIALYPGTREEDHYLSFMGEIPADRDYRPRIY